MREPDLHHQWLQLTQPPEIAKSGEWGSGEKGRSSPQLSPGKGHTRLIVHHQVGGWKDFVGEWAGRG